LFRNSTLPVLPLFCFLPYPELTLFSSAEKAKSYPVIQEETLDSIWVLKDLELWKYWMLKPVGEKHWLTIEPSIVDKPDNDEEENRIFTSQLGDITG
jgi:hypothetical protein